MRVRRVSGGREGELHHRAAQLRKSVDPLLPRLVGDAPADRFDKLRAELEEVREARDDSDRLQKLGGGWRDPMARAFAGLLRYYLEAGPTVAASAPYPGGDVSFAVLNSAPREAQIAVQLGDDPTKLLLGYLGMARKGLHFFASDDELVCTGRSAEPPPKFVTQRVEALPYRLAAGGSGRGFACPHLREGARRPYLEVGWSGAEATLRVCATCVRDDRQLLGALSAGVAVPDAETEFPVTVSLNVECSRGDACVHARLPELPRSLRKGYSFGKLSDAALLREYRTLARERLERTPEPLFVAAGRCFGDDRRAFLAALGPSPEEATALEEILPSVTGLFELDDATASRALEKLWPQHADAIVRSIVPDPERAERVVREARANPGRVSDLLRRAGREARERAVLDELPSYARLAPEARFVDAVARAARTQGSAEATKRLVELLPREGKERGLGYGLLLALGSAAPHRWQFTETEQEFGRALEPAGAALLAAVPARYHEALLGLLGRAGVADWGALDPTA